MLNIKDICPILAQDLLKNVKSVQFITNRTYVFYGTNFDLGTTFGFNLDYNTRYQFSLILRQFQDYWLIIISIRDSVGTTFNCLVPLLGRFWHEQLLWNNLKNNEFMRHLSYYASITIVLVPIASPLERPGIKFFCNINVIYTWNYPNCIKNEYSYNRI